MMTGAAFRTVQIGLATIVALGIIAYLATLHGEHVSAQEGGTATATPTGNLVVAPGEVQMGQTTLAVGLHVVPFDLEVAIEYSGHFIPEGESCDDAGTQGKTQSAVAPTWVTLNACAVGEGWARLVVSETGRVIEEVSVTVVEPGVTGQQTTRMVTISGVDSTTALTPGGSGDDFDVTVSELAIATGYELHTVALNASSAAFDQACTDFSKTDDVIWRGATKKYKVYGCVATGTTIWAWVEDMNGRVVVSSNFPGPRVKVKEPTVKFSSDTHSVNEGEEATITVELSHKSSENIFIPITVSNGTAEGTDYKVKGLSNQGTLYFAGLATSASFTIETDDDTEDEDDETVNISFGTLPSTVSGTGSHTSATLTIVDDDENTPPEITSGPSEKDHPECDDDPVGTYGASDDDGDSISWSLPNTPFETDLDDFSISNGGVLRFDDAPDFEDPDDSNRNRIYKVTVRASDNNGGADDRDVTVTVTNEDPTIYSGKSLLRHDEGDEESVERYLASDPCGGDIIWSLRGVDQFDFDISNIGLLTFDDTPDYENPADSGGNNRYEITVRASDAEGGRDDMDVTVEVENVDEDGSVTLSTTAPEVGAEITASLYDEDGRVRRESWRWQRSSNGVSWADISGATGDSYTPVRGDAGKRLRARVAYDDRQGRGKSATSGATAAVTQSNSAPTFDDGNRADRSVPENTTSGTPIGKPVSATDVDVDTLTYSLGGTDASSFQIVAASGQLQTKEGVTYDHETKSRYSVAVSVTDSKDEQGNTEQNPVTDDTITVTITVTDVNEPPGKPSALTVTSNGETSLNVAWSAPTNTGPTINDYDVQYRAGNSGPFTSATHTGATTQTTISGLSPDTAYEVQVRATNAEGTGSWSDSGTGSTDTPTPTPTPTPIPAPGAPTILTNVSVEHAKIRLTWAPVARATDYVIERKMIVPLAPDTWEPVANVTISTTSSEITAIITVSEPGKTFTHRVRARNAHGVSDPSNEVSTQALDQRPDKPTNLRYDFMIGNRGIELSWDAASGATTYEAALSDLPNLNQPRVIPANATSIDITGLTPRKVYYIRVRAVNGFGATESDVLTTTNMPEPKHWWGHQADHQVKYVIDSAMNNSAIRNSIATAVSSWNLEMVILGKNLTICALCEDDFTVTIKTVNNKNNSRDALTNDPNEGCGPSLACMKLVGSGGSNMSAGPGKHMENMYMVFEDPPITPVQDASGKWHDIEWKWTSDKSKNRTLVLCPPGTLCPTRIYMYPGRAMLHEFGHTLGLDDFYDDGTMNSLDAVMNEDDEIMPQDIEQLRAIYLLHTSH